ncbi:ATP-dependent helicase/nuclease subunit A [Caldalkalibacillus uzonensis]|uniref:ATP-dependent helicase/nuclease subunit A n=1 Tax=Caldalkalibacillus uzonensis TaxID=353224 RepID=A0ABU0CUW0_9BACI|nr:helicase-exonuclease AddAB subunit AddA [Caldalkalibacillus uzonensis]MDQ0339679.1 ATP-dependent helicase/nuclease subunit A [Caldalkalibacillus uzonensis]
MKVKAKPEGSQWTDEQWQAIAGGGNNMLVAAAAGSGKTAVLVERIIQKITDPDDPIDVDRLLIVTFTNAAASEMRKRIGEAIEKELSKRPASLHLRRQLSLLNRAMISTLHSFCLNVVRKHYYKLEIDPQFRIADETEAELLREEVLEELLEEEYGKQDNADFYALVDRYTSDRGDTELSALISKVYDFSRSHPDPDDWLEQMAASYEVDPDTPIDDLPWTSVLLQAVKLQLNGCRSVLEQALDWANAPGGPAPYGETLADDLMRIQALLHKQSWEEMYSAFVQFSFGKLKPVRGKDVDKSIQDKVKAARDEVKKQVEKLQELFSRPPQALVHDVREMAPLVRTLVRLVRAFGERYWEVKKARGLVDFNDLEHLALHILSDKGGQPSGLPSGQVSPSEVALDFQQQFVEVLVDEYQDTNLVQETILQLVSRENNLFMVGDVKQSIYRFRLAEPGLFLHKYQCFTRTGEGPGLCIDLARNFRSRREVLDATNYIFRQIMDESIGEIAYDHQAELKLGAAYPDYEDTAAELLVINRGEPVNVHPATGADEEEEGNREREAEEELESAQLEARLIARKIKDLIGKLHQVLDKETGVLRNITYRDIVILMRSMPWAPTIMEELKQQGIPVYAELSSGYFEAVEVSTMLSLLKVIDNPDQDIPLAAVLRSPIVGLSENELAKIRLQVKQGSYFTALKTACRTLAAEPLGKKVKQFYDQLQKWRIRARQGALSELIWQLYRETGYYDFVGGMPGGKQRQANLRALYDRARIYESTSFRGLFRFLRFIERIQDRGDDLGTARALGEQEDVVRLMTIHKSKGLEFPVVFVAGLGKAFNMQDLRGNVLLHKELGFGSRFIDPEQRITYPTLPQLALKQRLHLEAIAEEMRVLYVALTRAKEKLYLIGTVRDGEKALERWQTALAHREWLLPDHDRARATCYLDWIGPAVIRHREAKDWHHSGQPPRSTEVAQDPSRWKVTFVERAHFNEVDQEREIREEAYWQALEQGLPVPSSSPFQEKVKQQLTWRYPHQAASTHRSKQSVTEIKREWMAPDAYTDTQYIRTFRSSLAERPRFVQEQKLSAAEKGTAMHLVMQHVPLSAPVTEECVQDLVVRMVEQELLTEEQAEAIDIPAIVRFFESEVGQRLLSAPFVRREVPFSYGLPAHQAYRDWEGPRDTDEEEVVLIQGVIDCLFRDEQGLVLLDYKTDAISGRFPGGFEEAKPVLLERYQVQLELYTRAVEEIWQEHVTEKYLYFFDGGQWLAVP